MESGSDGPATVGEMEGGSDGPATVVEMEGGSDGPVTVVEMESGSDGPATVGEMEGGSDGPATVVEMEGGSGGPAPPPYYLYAVAESNSIQTVSDTLCSAVQVGDSPPPYYLYATPRAAPVHSRPTTVQNGTTTAQSRANRQSHTANPSHCHPCGFVLVLFILLISLVNPFAFCCAVAGIVYILAHNHRVCYFLQDCLH